MANVLHLTLQQGILINRPNRFIFEAVMDGQNCLLHCPVTGKINNCKNFSGLPVLCTMATNLEKRKTVGTAEAISFDEGRSWVGINQSKINQWIGQFLSNNLLSRMVDCEGAEIHPEFKVGDSRLDFAIFKKKKTSVYLEIKTPMRDLFLADSKGSVGMEKIGAEFVQRLKKHYRRLIDLTESGNRTIIGICFMYDAIPFSPPEKKITDVELTELIAYAQKIGVESWQINLNFSPVGIELRDYFQLSYEL